VLVLLVTAQSLKETFSARLFLSMICHKEKIDFLLSNAGLPNIIEKNKIFMAH
jgi:hypothetical protein